MLVALALLWMLSVAEALPEAVGLNRSEMTHEVPPANVPQELLSLKLPAPAPLSCTVETVSCADPLFETETRIGGLVDPSCCGGKDTAKGVTKTACADDPPPPPPPHPVSAHSAAARIPYADRPIVAPRSQRPRV